jgi:WD40 repeat protein
VDQGFVVRLEVPPVVPRDELFHRSLRLSFLSFSPDGIYLASAGHRHEADHRINIWRVKDGKHYAAFHGAGVLFLQGNNLLTDEGNEYFVRKFHNEQWPDSLQQRTGGYGPLGTTHLWPTHSLAVSHDGQMWAAGMSYHGGYAIDGEFPTRSKLHHFHKGNIPLEGIKVKGAFGSDQIHAIAFSPDDNLLALGGRFVGPDSGAIRLLETINGKLHSTIPFPQGQVDALAYSPDGTLLVAAGGTPANRSNESTGPSTLLFWDVNTYKVWWEVNTFKGRVKTLAFSPDGKILATAGDDNAVILWQMPSGKALALLQGHKPPVYALAFSPDGTKLAYTCDEYTIYLWDLTKVVRNRVR